MSQQPDINKVVITGNLVFDPEVRYTTKLVPVTNLKLAVHKKRRDTNEIETSFIGVTVFGSLAEIMGRTSRKGSLVMVEGEIGLERYTDHETNEKVERLAIIASFIRHICAPKPPAEVEEVAA